MTVLHRTTARPVRSAPASAARLAVGAALGAALAAPLLPATASAAPAPTAVALPAAPADRAVTGLFGSADATYDGVFRQSLAITGLAAVGASIPAASVRWLARQQCADGSFEAYRASLATPCRPADPVSYTGKDTNSTALGALALDAAGRTTRARKAAAWLRATQNKDGGFPYYPGGASDANSTGLALVALRAFGLTASELRSTRRSATAVAYLRSVQARCGAPAADRGGLGYQGPRPVVPDPLASGQAALGLSGSLPVTPRRPAATSTALRCVDGRATSDATVAGAASGWLARTLRANNGAMPSAFGPGVDLAATAWAVLALRARRTPPTANAVAIATITLERRAAGFVRGSDGVDRPAALGLLLLVADATGRPPRNFGGVNLVARLRATVQS
jgi:hypothetical protein